MIELRTLGSLELTSADSDAVASVLAQPRRAALLCYLAIAVPRGFHRRDTLSALFWPEYDAEQARHALRQSVYFLRRAMGSKTIVSRGDEELALACERVRCDVWEFDAAVDQGRPADALALYRGELLAGFHISAAPDFERWLDEERSRVRRRAAEAGWVLAAAREREGDSAGAEEAARRAAALSPTDETALRRLLLLLKRLGDRAAAVRAYEDFARKLQGEYELEPSAETRALVGRIRAESGESQATALSNQNGLPRAAGEGNSKARMGVEGYATGARVAAGDLLREFEVRSRGLLTEPRPVSLPSRARRPTAIVAGAVVMLLLLGLAGFYWRTQARERTVRAPPPPAGEAAPGIAVLPFAVQDSALANWREGLVDLVSISLTGVAGLRSVDSRTLLARWRERVRGVDIPELATALDVAERAGARYAVVGSLIANGPDLLLTAGVHEVAGRRMLGTARSQAPADSMFTLVDRLTLEILRLILSGKARELPRIELARVSTTSLPALKSYLEGEVFFRRSQFQSAAEAYAKAVDADSNFVLARYRLGLSRWWVGAPPSASVPDPFNAEVASVADRLPPHEAAIFRASRLRARDVRAARELLEGEARRHPDDAETWHELGELYHHSGAQALAPAGAADRAFARAIELDSTFTLPYLHRIDHAISMGDASGAARLLGTFSRLAPESPYVAWYRLVTGFAFGDPTVRSTAEAALDTLNTHDLIWVGGQLQGQRCCWDLAEQVLRKARERRDELRPEATRELFWVSLAQGKAREALGWVDDPFIPEEQRSRMLHLLDELGVPIPAARLDAALGLHAADSVDAVRLFYVGSYAASRVRWQVLRRVEERLLSFEQRLRATGNSSEAGFTRTVRQALEGYAAWRRGQRDDALRLLERSQPRAVGNWPRGTVNIRLRWWLGRLLLEMGRPREALPYFESLTESPLAAEYERGRIYEQIGQLKQAREAYALFLAPRQQADPAFQPMIQSARAALQRLAVAGIE
jgi:DNA-binding SARP family transcriptional activator/TolB-like protein